MDVGTLVYSLWPFPLPYLTPTRRSYFPRPSIAGVNLFGALKAALAVSVEPRFEALYGNQFFE